MPYDIEEAAQILADNVEGFETRTLQRIGKRIKATGRLNSADTKALKNMANIGIPLQEIYSDLAAVTELNAKEVERILSEHMSSEVERSQAIFQAKGVPFVPYPDNEFAQQMVKHWAEVTNAEMINLSRTKAIGFTKTFPNGRSEFTPLDGAFQQAMDKAVVAVRTGTTDFNTAMRDTIQDLGGSGVVANYGSGVTRQLDSMIRQNLLYGAKKSAQAYQDHIGEQLGADGFEVDYHPHPRPSHAFMGGKVFSYHGDIKIDGITYPDGAEALDRLNDYNCYHFARPFFIGISQPAYDDKWVAEQKAKDNEILEYTTPAGNVIKGNRYFFTQKQRELERGIRAGKRTEMTAKAAGNNTLARQEREKVKMRRSYYDDLSEKTGLQPMKKRMTVSGYNRKIVDKSVENDIIKENKKSPVVNGKNAIGEWRRRDSFTYAIDDIIDYQGFNGKPIIANSIDDFNDLVQKDSFIASRTFSSNNMADIELWDNQLKCKNGENYFHVNCGEGGAQYGQGMYCAADYTKGTVSEQAFNHEITEYTRDKKYAKTEWLSMEKTAKILEIPKNAKASEYISDKYRNSYIRKYAQENQKEAVETYIQAAQDVEKLTFRESNDVIDAAYNHRAQAAEPINDLLRRGLDATIDKDPGVMAAEMGYDAINAAGHGETGSYTIVLNRTKLVIYGGDDFEYKPK